MHWECWECYLRQRLKRKPLVNDPGMHHGKCRDSCWASLTRGGGENVPSIPGACAAHNFTYLARGPWRNHQWIYNLTKIHLRNLTSVVKHLPMMRLESQKMFIIFSIQYSCAYLSMLNPRRSEEFFRELSNHRCKWCLSDIWRQAIT